MRNGMIHRALPAVLSAALSALALLSSGCAVRPLVEDFSPEVVVAAPAVDLPPRPQRPDFPEGEFGDELVYQIMLALVLYGRQWELWADAVEGIVNDDSVD